MNINLKTIILSSIVTLLLFLSCQEIYMNENLDANERIPCVDARLTNSVNHQYVKLYYAHPYNVKTYEEVSGAIVKVIDEQGNEFIFNELYAGYYQTERGYLVGSPGMEYVLQVELPDGLIIESYPQEMPDTLGIKNIDYRFTTQDYVFTDNNGDFQVATSEGYAYRITPDEPNQPEVYYRLKSDFYVYSTKIEASKWTTTYPNETGDSIIEARIHKNIYYDCYEFFTTNDLPIIGKLNQQIKLSDEERSKQTQFLVKDYNQYTSNDFIEWIVLADVYSMSASSYNYYKNLNEQLTAPNRIYDPIPNQLSGNMYCPVNKEQKVFGVFDVTAKTRRCHSLYKYISHGAESIQSRFYPDSTQFMNDCIVSNITLDTIEIDIVKNEE